MTDVEDIRSTLFAVEIDLDPHANHALHRSGVPLVKSVRVTNMGESDVADVRVALWAEPDLAPRMELPAVSLPAGASLRLDDVVLPLSAGRLARQTEREPGLLHLELLQNGEVLLHTKRELWIDAHGAWPGPASLPEILAAFVLPDDPAVEQILSRADHLLRERKGRERVDGYIGNDPEGIRDVVRSVYDATQDRGIALAAGSAELDRGGQIIRGPEQVITAEVAATHLELATLFAAVLERAGLGSLLVLLEDRALVGCWLEDTTFVDPAVDELGRIQRRLDHGSLFLFDPTGAAQDPPLAFDEAIAEATKRVSGVTTLLYAVDVEASRRREIRSLPLAEGAAEEEEAPAPQERTPLPRVERWKRNLLDLTLRNRLLNYRPTKKSIAFRVPDVTALERMLFDGDTFRVVPETDETTSASVEEAFAKGRLTSVLEEAELERRLTHIYRAARSSIQEGGANTLYLAVGFLVWRETPTSTVERRAPVLLYPLSIIRRSIAEGIRGYRLELADDDPQLNVTLLQKLEADFDIRVEGLTAPSAEEGAEGASALLARLRLAVRPMEHWQVTDAVTLGLFSFTKYLMWVDLDRRHDVLAQNDVVRHLLDNPQASFGSGEAFPDPSTFDRERATTSTFLPLDADSSQQGAIFAAADGRTFVLEGPPGTGKSQTIANLICHTLATGKRVLFVSQKMAALDVVIRRLRRIGLGPFCLELHSNRARKRLVLEQLQEALDVAGTESPAAWPGVADDLATAKDGVNETRDALHQVRRIGTSAHEALARLVALADEPSARLSFGAHDALDAERVAALRTEVQEAAALLDEVGDVRDHPWRASRLTAWRPSIAGHVEDLAPRLQEKAATLEERTTALAADLDVEGHASSRSEIEATRAAAQRFADTPAPAPALLASDDFDADRTQVESWIQSGRLVDKHRADFLPEWDESLIEIDLETTGKQIERSRASAWPLSWWRARKPRRRLRDVHRGGRLPPTADLLAILARAEAWRYSEGRLRAAHERAATLLGARWQGRDTDWDALEKDLEWIDAWRRLRARLQPRMRGTAADFEARWLALASDGRRIFAGESDAGRRRQAFEDALGQLDDGCAQAQDAFALDAALAWGESDQDAWAARLGATATSWLRHKAKLRAWCAWVDCRTRLETSGLTPLVADLADGSVGRDDVEVAFEKGLWTWWLDALFESDARLSRMRGAEENTRVETFRSLDARVMETVQEVVRARLAEHLPRSRAAAASRSDSSEMGILHRELMRKRNMPLRRLFERIPGVASLLKPCMLMSPLSVAQYLSPEFPAFDLVVFDEASQIPPWDAVGAIARGTKLVVVGDSKQLPPTTFFQRDADEGEAEDEDDLQEMESILDECIAAGLPRLHLGWHYRSRHESLIAFSNAHYYEDRLLTFPAARREAPALGVSLREVPDGVYDRSGTRTNRAEAEALVADLVGRLRAAEGEHLTYGVVTFSMAQQSLVEDLLEAERRADPALETFFDESRREPVFVKNLENVQGDERDVILLSVCYGPDASGRVTLNFGPLNREGGERRLNVAVTRARRQVRVFSTLRAEQIDLARTQATGARHLKAFLEYARDGQAALGGRHAPASSDGTGPSFEGAVASALERRGWSTDLGVGSSAYRIDVGVRDPDDASRYLAAIEGDGLMYATAATARDRHRTRPSVLEHLGWDHHRVWAVDWWQDAAGETDQLVALLESFRSARRQAEADAELPPTDAEDVDDVEAPAVEAAPPPDSAASEPSLGLSLGGEQYRKAAVRAYEGKPRAFYDASKNDLLLRRMQAVIEEEAPVAIELIARRVADAFGLKQITPRLRDRVEALAPLLDASRPEDLGADVLWRRDQDPSAYGAFRVPAPGDVPLRRARHIPAAEAANAAGALLREHVGIGRDDLARETARLFGYRRLTEKVVVAMASGVDHLLSRGGAVEEDGKLRPPA